MEQMNRAQWFAEGVRRFGADQMAWKFVCPSCGHVATVQDWKDAGASEPDVGFNCIGRFKGDPEVTAKAAFRRAGGPCNYTSGGLFKIHELEVAYNGVNHPMFRFADMPPSKDSASPADA